ncbi:MAG: hypothetical protein DRN12_05270 [Thermoplasmata archaeon]|nr:MAG: hypothetical protein DRN12_05270 [Thermoplasmata archaeon]
MQKHNIILVNYNIGDFMARQISESTKERVKTVLAMGWSSRSFIKDNARVHLKIVKRLLADWEQEGKLDKIVTLSGLELWRWKDDKSAKS